MNRQIFVILTSSENPRTFSLADQGIEIFDKDEHPEKAQYPMDVTDEGVEMKIYLSSQILFKSQLLVKFIDQKIIFLFICKNEMISINSCYFIKKHITFW